MGTDVLTISVLAIIICAPVGATGMAILGPRFLAKGEEEQEQCSAAKKEEGCSSTVKSDSNGKEESLSRF